MQQLNLPTMTPAYRVKVEHDRCPESPRNWDNLGTMVCWHRNYELGDKQPSEDPQEYKLQLAENAEPGIEERVEAESKKMASHISAAYGTPAWREAMREIDNYAEARVEAVLDKHYVILPLYLYDHGGITMNTTGFSCPWDSGQVGFIYVSRKDIEAEYGWKVLTAKRRQKIMEYLRGEVKIYDKYLCGEVYGYIVEEQIDGEWEEIDSCWGFYGDAIDDVRCYVEQYGFTQDQVKSAFADVGEPVPNA